MVNLPEDELHVDYTKYVSIFVLILFLSLTSLSISLAENGTRLLRQPSLSDKQITFTYGADLWVADLDGTNVKRITSTPGVESDPHFSPDGNWIAFTSNRSGVNAVYVVSNDEELNYILHK